ncbi:hypothetical protein ABEX78_32425 [Priestia megaterium]
MKYTQIEEKLIQDIHNMIMEYEGDRKPGRYSLKRTNKSDTLYLYEWEYIRGKKKETKTSERYKWTYKGKASDALNAEMIKGAFNSSIPTQLSKALTMVVKRQGIIEEELEKREIEYIEDKQERLKEFSRMIEEIKDENIGLWISVDEIIRKATEMVQREDQAIEYERKGKYFNQETN